MGNATARKSSRKSRHRSHHDDEFDGDRELEDSKRSKFYQRCRTPSKSGRKSACSTRDECENDVKAVHKMYKDQQSTKKSLETELASMRKQLTDTLDQLDSTKVELGNTIRELDYMRSELGNVRRDLNREIQNFTTSFNQLSTAVQSLTCIEKVSKVAKRSAKWRIKLHCQCIELKPVPVAPVMVKLTNFSSLRSNDEWFTYMFYSHENGYKLCLRVFAAGFEDARSTSLSVFVQHMDESNVDHLDWPMKGVIKLKLVNQLKDKHHHLSTICYNDDIDEMLAGQVTSFGANGMGEPHFISNEELFKTTPTKQFLRDDCIYFQIYFKQ